MDINKHIDSWYESIKSQEINNNNRIEFLFILFFNLKTMGFCLKDFDANAISYIYSKLQTKHINEYLDNLSKQIVFLDIRQAADTILTDEKIVEIKTEATETPSPQREEDIDVLDVEGYIELPPQEPMKYDPKVLELLGIKNE